MRHALALAAAIALAACSTTQQAPVIERAPVAKKPVTSDPPRPAGTEKDWRPDSYTVKKGDTLYSIGLEYGFDYKEIAQWNNIQPPYLIRVGQQLRLKEGRLAAAPAATPPQDTTEAVATPLKTETVTARPLDGPPLLSEPKAVKQPYSEQALAATPAAKPAKPADRTATKVEPARVEPARTEGAAAEPGKSPGPAEKTSAAAVDDEALEWSWPAGGKVLSGFNDAANFKGVDIGGNLGQPVLAAAPGRVVYSGSGLRGYGKLVIIKHNKTYLSAYAHNNQILVKEGQEVAKGQKIAEMGSSDSDRVKLHFQIRRLGKPVDPSRYLPPG